MDSLYSAFVIEAGSQRPETWQLFDYGRSQNIPCTTIVATNAHTNMPRSGASGLPMNWIMQADRWRAGANLRFLTDDVLEWASETSCRLVYNGQSIAVTPLSDLLLAPHPLSNPSGYGNRSNQLAREIAAGHLSRPEPLVLRENISFWIEMQCPQRAIDHLSTFLVENSLQLTDKRESVNDKIRTPRLVGWIWLEGVLSRGAY